MPILVSSPISDPRALHPIEKAILSDLASGDVKPIQQLVHDTSLGIDQIRRGLEWLKFKNLISVQEITITVFSLDSAGKVASERGLPERRLVNAVKSGLSTLGEIVASGLLGKEEVSASVAAAKRLGWLMFGEGGKLKFLDAASSMSQEEKAIALLQKVESISESDMPENERRGVDLLRKRPGYIIATDTKETKAIITNEGKEMFYRFSSMSDEHTTRRLSPELISTGKWKELRLSAIDVTAPSPKLFPGRRHPLTDIIEEIKEIFVGLGFTEIEGSFIQSAFWNFDALYTPQDHPAREMQDTFYLQVTQKIPATEGQISKVAGIHKKGWKYDWAATEAGRTVLRTHTTPVTLQFLASQRPETGRWFSVGRVFRNEKVSYKHLVEFHQVEGVATYPGASLRDLIGLQTEFYKKMGIKKIKFWPTFFPYTEPSLQSMVYNEVLGKWVELFGMGIFRPEVTLPLGIKNPVLAWGGGLERIAMLRFGLNDVRELYAGRLSWLRSVPECQL